MQLLVLRNQIFKLAWLLIRLLLVCFRFGFLWGGSWLYKCFGQGYFVLEGLSESGSGPFIITAVLVVQLLYLGLDHFLFVQLVAQEAPDLVQCQHLLLITHSLVLEPQHFLVRRLERLLRELGTAHRALRLMRRWMPKSLRDAFLKPRHLPLQVDIAPSPKRLVDHTLLVGLFETLPRRLSGLGKRFVKVESAGDSGLWPRERVGFQLLKCVELARVDGHILVKPNFEQYLVLKSLIQIRELDHQVFGELAHFEFGLALDVCVALPQ